jgi:hypothetical protein
VCGNGVVGVCMGSQGQWTPLQSACKEGHVEVVAMLLEHGADVNEADMVGWECESDVGPCGAGVCEGREDGCVGRGAGAMVWA